MIAAWAIQVLVNGEVKHLEYIPVDPSDGWEGGEDHMLQAVADAHTIMAGLLAERYVAVTLQVVQLEINPELLG